jgi:hypothetical protein
MRALLILTMFGAVAASSAFASSDVIVSPNSRHHLAASYERHAERFNLDGAECVARPFQMKSADGQWVTGKSVDCQE